MRVGEGCSVGPCMEQPSKTRSHGISRSWKCRRGRARPEGTDLCRRKLGICPELIRAQQQNVTPSKRPTLGDSSVNLGLQNEVWSEDGIEGAQWEEPLDSVPAKSN